MCGLCLDSVLMLENASVVILMVRSPKVGLANFAAKGSQTFKQKIR